MTETRCPLPKMARIRQTFARPRVDDVAAEMREQMQVLTPLIRPGMTVGLTVGSRGIQNILTMLEVAVQAVRGCGASPVLLAAMGSHGGAMLAEIDPKTTLFIISSKSGGTIEPRLMLRAVRDQLSEVMPDEELVNHLVAITDPGSQLEKQAKDLQSKGEALQAQVAKMSAKEREDKQMEFLRLRRAFEEKSRNFARKVENTENQIRQSMAQQIYDAATTIAKQQKLDLILDAAAGSVMYATPTLDITKPVLAEVNRLWKAGGSKFPEPNTGKK